MRMYRGIKCPPPPKGVSAWALRRGIEVELEHTSSRRVAACIRNIHLREGKRYYELLDELERRLKRGSP